MAHNKLFNPTLAPDTEVLGFEPDWARSTSDPVVSLTWPPGYVIAQIDVREPGTYKRYVEMVGPIVASFGGEFLVRGGKAEHHEGTPTGNRTVVIELPKL